MCLLQWFWKGKADCSPHQGKDPILEAVSAKQLLSGTELVKSIILILLIFLFGEK